MTPVVDEWITVEEATDERLATAVAELLRACCGLQECP